jgi:outer membrane receptor for ferrienterochelin and colicin
MKNFQFAIRAGSFLAVSLLLGAAAFAQTTTATIEGTITDTTGGVIPGVTIDVQGETLARAVVSDTAGFYRAVALPPGRYTVVATLSGFQPRRIEGIEVALNHTVIVDVRMEVAGQAETVVVRALMPRIDPTTSSTSSVVSAREIESIPLNGRNYLDLVMLTPGAIINSNTRTDLSDRDTRGAILGERAGNTAFLIDGLENNDDFHGGVFQAYTQDAIQEFEVIAAGYKAEFGRGSGGVVNAITKSGTNTVKGSAFFFLRNDALDASSVAGAAPPDLARYNSGAIVGGPMTRDRDWYFGSIEQVFERREAIFPANIPAVLTAGEDFSKQPETENYRLFGKYTRKVSDRSDLRGEASWSRLENLNQLASAAALPSASNDNSANTLLASATYTSILSPRFLLESSAGYRDQRFGQNSALGSGFSYSITFLDGGGSFDFGPRYGSQQTLDQRYFTAREVASLFAGDRHSAKAGIEYVRTSVDGSNGQGLQNVIATTRANFARFGTESFQIPQGVGFIAAGDEQSQMRNNGVSLFAQDDWRPIPQLTLNLGLRYDYDSKFADANNAAPRLGVVWAIDGRTIIRANWGLFYDRYRLGLAQAVPELGGFNGKTVVEQDYPRLAADALNRAGGLGRLAVVAADPFVLHKRFGIAENAVVTRANVQALTGLTPDQFVAAVRTFAAGFGTFLPVDFSPSTGYLRQDLGAAFQDQIRVARPFETPYNNTITLGGERVVAGDLSVGATYAHRMIRNILGVRLTNLSPQSRVVGAAITTDGGPIQRTYGPWYEGDYDAVILSLAKPFNNRYQFQVSYTYARGTDNLANPNLGLGVSAQGGGAVPTDNLNLEFDRGNSDLVVPHGVVASGVVALPAGLSLSGVFRGTSGTYFSAAGGLRDYDGDGIASSRPVGTARNQFRGPNAFNTDVRLEKRFTFGRYTASGLVEVFNLFNARNPRLIDNTFTGSTPTATFGTVRVPLPGRETQIGLRFLF